LQGEIQKSLFEEEEVLKAKAQYIGSAKCVDILPRCAPSKRLRSEKQIKTLDLLHLLLIEMLYGSEIFKNEEEEVRTFSGKSRPPAKF